MRIFNFIENIENWRNILTPFPFYSFALSWQLQWNIYPIQRFYLKLKILCKKNYYKSQDEKDYKLKILSI